MKKASYNRRLISVLFMIWNNKFMNIDLSFSYPEIGCVQYCFLIMKMRSPRIASISWYSQVILSENHCLRSPVRGLKEAGLLSLPDYCNNASLAPALAPEIGDTRSRSHLSYGSDMRWPGHGVDTMFEDSGNHSGLISRNNGASE